LLVICGAAIVITIICAKSETFLEFKNSMKRSKAEESVLKELCQQEDYEGLSDYISEYKLEGEAEYYPYLQLNQMYRSREEFREYWLEFVETSDEEFEKWAQYGVCYRTLDSCMTILQKDWRGYSVIPQENQEFYNEMQEEVEVFLAGEMGLSDEEITFLYEHKVYEEEWDDFYQNIYKKKGWKYSES